MDNCNKPIFAFEPNGFHYTHKCGDEEEKTSFIAYQNIGEINDVYIKQYTNTNWFSSSDKDLVKCVYCCFDIQCLSKNNCHIYLSKPSYKCNKFIKYTEQQLDNKEVSFWKYVIYGGYKNPDFNNFKQTIKSQLDQDIIELKHWRQLLIDNFNQWKQPKNIENNII